MGREVSCEIREKTTNDVVWNSADALGLFVCGRDPVTNFLLVEADEETESIDISSKDEFDKIMSEVTDYERQDKAEADKAQQTLRDLKTARRNARNCEEFSSFSEMIEATERWIEDFGHSRATSVIRMLNAALSEYRRHPLKYRNCGLYVVVSD